MAIGTYSDLKAAIANWMARSGNSNYVAQTGDFIALAEGELNRELGAQETDATLTGTLNSRRITTGLTIVEPIALWLAESGVDEEPVQLQPDGSFPYLTTAGKPRMAALDDGGTYLDFECPLEAAYPFRFRYRGRIALSDSATTNWLLTNHPDVYFAAALVWGAAYNKSFSIGGEWRGLLDRTLPQVKAELARKKRSTLRVDPALSAPLGPGSFNYSTGQ